jgi:hypothetical protein
LTAAKGSAADDDFFRSGGEKALSAGGGADAATNANAHGGAAAEFADQARVAAAAHRGVEVNDVEQRVFAEAFEKAEDIVHSKTPLAPVDKLDGAAVLEVDARDDHFLMERGEWRSGPSPAKGRLRVNSVAKIPRRPPRTGRLTRNDTRTGSHANVSGS